MLYSLSKSAEPVRLTDLHRRVLLSQPALSRLVDRLVERGLVERRVDAGDKRVVRLTLTEAGRRCQREVGRAHARDVTAAMTAQLSDADLEELKRITRALLGTKEGIMTTLVVVSAGTGDPSSTRLLADRTAQRVAALASENGESVDIRVIDLREIAAEVTTALVSQHVGPGLRAAIDAIAAADGVDRRDTGLRGGRRAGCSRRSSRSSTPTPSSARPSCSRRRPARARHALVADDQMRGMFGYLRAMTVPTALFAAPEDWADNALAGRIDRAALELVDTHARRSSRRGSGGQRVAVSDAVRLEERPGHRLRQRPHASRRRRSTCSIRRAT